jgi:putative ABC transport system permease protein
VAEFRLSRSVYRRLTRVLPAADRASAGPALEETAMACLARERARLGAAGIVLAWARLLIDLAVTGRAMRRRARQSSKGPTYGPKGPANSIDPDWTPPNRQGALDAMMDVQTKDLRYALRSLFRQPGFTAVTVLTLALGIGANTAVFSVVNGVLLRPLGYPRPERLEFITSQFPTLGFQTFWVSVPEFVEFAKWNQSYSSVGAYSVGAINLDTSPPSRPVSALVTSELMPTLGVRPLRGRWFEAADCAPNAPPVAILSYELWQRAYGGDEGVLGRMVQINNRSEQIVGIMPRGYDVHDSKVEVWRPLTINPANFPNQRGGHFLYLVGRLKDGLTREQANADIERLAEDWTELVQGAHAPTNTSPGFHRLNTKSLHDDVIGNIRQPLMVLQGAVGLVLLIACANLANLLVARAGARLKEYAVRTALGATRWRLFRQLFTEGLVLTTLAAAVGVGLAYLGLSALLTVNPDAIPRTAEITMDVRVLLFTLGVTVATGLIFALVPLLHIGTVRATWAFREASARTTAGAGRVWARSALIIIETTLAVMLVVSAGLLIRSFVNLLSVDMGFNRAGLTTFGVVLPAAQYNPQQRVAFYDQLMTKLREVPSVKSVAAMTGLPPQRNVNANDTDFEHIPNAAPGQPPLPGVIPQNVDYWQFVSVGYTETMGIPVVRGRSFGQADIAGAPVALINETLAQRFFKDRDPLMGRIKPGFGDQLPWFQIVGVVKDVKQRGVSEPTGTELYFLTDQGPKAVGFARADMNFVVRAAQPLSALGGSFRQAVQQLDPTLPLIRMRSMDEVIGDAVARPRFLMLLLGIFAGLALALAAVGIYGILSHTVAERLQEIGIRMALGADRGNIVSLILGRGLVLAGIGIVLGLTASYGLSRVLGTLLFNVSATDPLTLGGVAAVIAAVAAAACVIPAWRAARVDPLKVLRES